jgi:hypothetical protein
MSCFRWLVNLQTPYTPYWESLVNNRLFTDQATILIEGMPDGGGEYLLFSSVDLNTLDNEEKILDLAREKMKYLNGLLYFLNISHEPLQLGYSVFRNEWYDSQTIIDNKNYSKLRPFFTLIQQKSEELNPKSDIDCFAKVIRIFAKHEQTSFDDLYKVWDIIKALNISHQRKERNKTSEINKFTHTANNPGAIGDSARHGLTEKDPPIEPMSINEARELIKRESQELFELIFNFKIENKTSYSKFDFNKISWDEIFRNM